MNKFFTIGIVLVVLIVGFFIFRGSTPSGDIANNYNGNDEELLTAPDFSLKDFNGNTVTLADFKGKFLLINSWAAWCPFCVKELDDFDKIQKEFGEEITIIAIDRSESLSTAKKFTDELGVTNSLVFLLDPSDSFYRSIGGFSMPETIFVTKGGKIIHHKRGPMPLDEIRQRINDILSRDD